MQVYTKPVYFANVQIDAERQRHDQQAELEVLVVAALPAVGEGREPVQ